MFFRVDSVGFGALNAFVARVVAHMTSDYTLTVFQVDEALKIKNTDIAKELCLPPVKLHCSSK